MIFILIYCRTYKLCLTVGTAVCSEGFSFDSVSTDHLQAEDQYGDYDYNERVTPLVEDVEVTGLSLDHALLENLERKKDERKAILNKLKSVGFFGSEENSKEIIELQETGNIHKNGSYEDIIKLLYNELEEEDGEDIFRRIGQDNKKIMHIIGRVLELFLLILVIITTVLCIFLLCAMKFC